MREVNCLTNRNYTIVNRVIVLTGAPRSMALMGILDNKDYSLFHILDACNSDVLESPYFQHRAYLLHADLYLFCSVEKQNRARCN